MAVGQQGTKVGSVYVEIVGKTDKFTRAMSDMDAQAKRSTASVRQAIQKTEHETKSLTGGVDMLKASFVAIGSALVFNSINDISDAFSLMRSRIRLVTQEGESLFDIEDKLAKQAFTNRANLKSTVDLYTRLRQTRSDLSDEAARDIVDKWSKSLIVSASSASEAASSTLQFSQAMAAGVLSGQELRSVVQGNISFANYLAQSLGITTGQLKQMGEEGKLTTDVILDGLSRVGDTIEHDFAKKFMTIHQAMTNIETATIRLVGSIDQATGGSQGTAYWINQLAGAIEIMTTYVRGSTPAVEQMRVQTDKLNTTIKATDEVIARGGIKQLGEDAKTVLAPLTEVDEKLAEIQKRLAESGKGAKISLIGQQEAANLQQFIEIKKLEDELRTLERPQLGRGGDAGLTVGSRAAISAARKALDEARIAYGKGLVRLSELQSTPDASFRTPVDKAAVDILQTQLKLELAKARGNDAEAARLEDVLMSEKLIVEFKQKGLNTEEATAKAAGHVAALRRAINSENEKARKAAEEEAGLRFQLAIADAEGNKAKVADLESQLEINRRIVELEDQGVTATEARAKATKEVTELRSALNAATEKELRDARELRDLEYQIALAANQGDTKREDALKRELEVRRQIKELIDLGYGEDQAGAIAAYRVDSLISDPSVWIGFEAGVADATKRGLLQAIETGEWGEAFGQILTDVTRDALSRALDVLWEALADVDWGGEGSGWGGFLNMVGSSFAGNKAGGGGVTAGRKYRVGEMGSEWFVPSTDGFIVPNNAGANVRSLGQSQRISVGGAQIIINGNADSVTRAEIAQTMDAWGKGLPSIIDSRLADRRTREGW